MDFVKWKPQPTISNLARHRSQAQVCSIPMSSRSPPRHPIFDPISPSLMQGALTWPHNPVSLCLPNPSPPSRCPTERPTPGSDWQCQEALGMLLQRSQTVFRNPQTSHPENTGKDEGGRRDRASSVRGSCTKESTGQPSQPTYAEYSRRAHRVFTTGQSHMLDNTAETG